MVWYGHRFFREKMGGVEFLRGWVTTEVKLDGDGCSFFSRAGLWSQTLDKNERVTYVGQGAPGGDRAERSTDGRAAEETARVPHRNHPADPRETGGKDPGTARQVPGGREAGRAGQDETTEAGRGENQKAQRTQVRLARTCDTG